MAKKSKASTVSRAPRMTAQDRKWRAESDLRSLREVEEIRGDPTRLKSARKVANQEMKALKKISKG